MHYKQRSIVFESKCHDISMVQDICFCTGDECIYLSGPRDSVDVGIGRFPGPKLLSGRSLILLRIPFAENDRQFLNYI